MPGGKKAENEKASAKKKFSRRDFLASSGAVVAVDALIATTPGEAALAASAERKGNDCPKSQGYLVYDSRKCAGCTTCMLSCSLVHYGVHSLSLSRIQIMQDSFGKFPNDVKVAPCRQCVAPVCVQNCPTGAAFIDTANGNIRRIDGQKCIGCKTCIRMCPQQPHRTVWIPSPDGKSGKSSKCDLCMDTPYWNEKGGVAGKQACVESCPMKAIKFVSETPNQEETDGYDINLRNEHWIRLGLVDDSRIQPPGMGGFGGGAPKPRIQAAKPKE
jgi:protein NrfC